MLSGIAVDGAGTVYVVGFSSDNAFKITPGGGCITYCTVTDQVRCRKRAYYQNNQEKLLEDRRR